MELVMENSNSEYERYQKASKQVREIKGFYGHLTSYVIVLAILIYLNLKYTPEYLWFIWTMLGWGIGLLSHAIRVFNWFPFLNKEWEERKIKQFMEEDKNNNKFE
jgi:2TM domain